jgi:sigma-E factor negative regulatory protein RseA
MKPESPADAAEARQLISALVDGEADAGDLARGCAAWAMGDADARRCWHAYHLIGDVLRSEDLASAPARDRAFLQTLRLRLAREPAVPVPPPLPARTGDAPGVPRRRPVWVLPAAMAAGVMALATGLVLTLGPTAQPGAAGPAMAAAPSAARVAALDSGSPPQPEPAAVGSRVLRDAQLDRYLRAHREYGAALPGSLPGGSGRSVSTVSFER